MVKLLVFMSTVCVEQRWNMHLNPQLNARHTVIKVLATSVVCCILAWSLDGEAEKKPTTSSSVSVVTHYGNPNLTLTTIPQPPIKYDCIFNLEPQ